MKIIKYILIGIGSLIALVLIVALFVKKDYAIERVVTINKPNQVVFDYIKYVKNQDNYSKWNMTDPAMKKTYKGEDGAVGFVYGWESTNKNVGTGEQEIVAIKDGERMDMKLRFKIPFETEDNAYMTTLAKDTVTTEVRWGFNGTMPYPMNIMLLMMDMDKQIGGDLETGLVNLKAVMEK